MRSGAEGAGAAGGAPPPSAAPAPPLAWVNSLYTRTKRAPVQNCVGFTVVVLLLFNIVSVARLVVTPFRRTSCVLPAAVAPLDPTARFVVVSLFDDRKQDSRFTGMQKVVNMSIANKVQYTGAKGYDFVMARGDQVDASRPAAWSKLLAVERVIDNYDWVLFVDVDVMIMNHSISLESLVSRAQPHHDLILTHDTNGVNDGVFLMRNTAWSKWLLKEMWAQDQLVDCSECPFEYEQRALHYMLRTPRWKRMMDHMPRWDGDSQDVAHHILALPQCALNSYLLPPMWPMKGGGLTQYRKSHYTPGDFVIHTAGHLRDMKVRILQWAYEHSVPVDAAAAKEL